MKAEVARFQAPVLWRGLWQILSTWAGFLGLCAAMYATLGTSYWLTLVLAVIAAGFVVRIFIIQHDCGHGSFFRSRRANDTLGLLCSLVTLTPYADWRRQHAGHHAIWNDLDRRRSGSDIYSTCLTVAEYRQLARWDRLVYRVSRHPFVALGILPPLIFLFLYRVPFDTPRHQRRERRAVYLTNVAIAVVIGALGLILGFRHVLEVQLPIMLIASMIGVMLFSVQHRFETAVWLRRSDWNPQSASLDGASYLRLPRVLQWFSGNIGFHHVHHLNPRIPNYRLSQCHAAIPALQRGPVLTLAGAWRSLSLALWDEDRKRMIDFRKARGLLDQGPRIANFKEDQS
jgi:omega-6 fatty acid desaturase (delta-12 desaturase)